MRGARAQNHTQALRLGGWLLLGLGTFLLSELSLATPVEGQGTALFWLGAGLTLGVLTQLPYSAWAGPLATVFLVCLISNRNHDIPWPLSFSFALSNIIEPAVGASLLRVLTKRTHPSLVGQALLLAVAGAVACLVGASIGVGSLMLANSAPNPARAFELWFINDFLGVIVIAPFVITWWPKSSWAAPRRRPTYGLELFGAVLLVGVLGYSTASRDGSFYWGMLSLYAHLAVLLLCALRLGPRGATLTSVFISSLAVLGTVQGHGPFVAAAHEAMGRATALQAYLVATSFVGLIPALLLTERARATASLAAREEEIGAIFRSLGEGVLVTDESGLIRYENAAARRLLDREETSNTGRPLSDAVVIEGIDPGEDLATRVQKEGKVIRSTEPRRLLRRDQSERWVAHSGAPILSATGEISGAVIVLSDETERQAHAAQLAETERHLAHAQKIRAVGDLAAGVAHDFNNILTAIQGSAQLIQFDARSDQQELVADLLEATNKAKQLTAQLSVFNRNDPVEFAPHDLNGIVLGMKSMLSRLLGADVRLRIHCSDAPLAIQGDRGQLEQILVNLAINARDAMPVGGMLDISIRTETRTHPRPALALAGRPTSEYVVVEVEDSGQGMDAVTRRRIFEPFFTTKPSGAGTGLGLATVQMVCERHQGFVEVESELGKGSCFRVYLPRLYAVLETQSSPAPMSYEGAGERILVVEDSAELRAPIQRLLKRKGFMVAIAEGPHQALRLVATQPFDLVLTDVIMPDMNGKELADRLNELYPEIPVLFMSGYSDGVLGQRVEGLGGQSLLKKPFTADELTRAILKAVRRHTEARGSAKGEKPTSPSPPPKLREEI